MITHSRQEHRLSLLIFLDAVLRIADTGVETCPLDCKTWGTVPRAPVAERVMTRRDNLHDRIVEVYVDPGGGLWRRRVARPAGRCADATRQRVRRRRPHATHA